MSKTGFGKYRDRRRREERLARKLEESAWLEFNFILKTNRSTEPNTNSHNSRKGVSIDRN